MGSSEEIVPQEDICDQRAGRSESFVRPPEDIAVLRANVRQHMG